MLVHLASGLHAVLPFPHSPRNFLFGSSIDLSCLSFNGSARLPATVLEMSRARASCSSHAAFPVSSYHALNTNRFGISEGYCLKRLEGPSGSAGPSCPRTSLAGASTSWGSGTATCPVTRDENICLATAEVVTIKSLAIIGGQMAGAPSPPSHPVSQSRSTFLEYLPRPRMPSD